MQRWQYVPVSEQSPLIEGLFPVAGGGGGFVGVPVPVVGVPGTGPVPVAGGGVDGGGRGKGSLCWQTTISRPHLSIATPGVTTTLLPSGPRRTFNPQIT